MSNEIKYSEFMDVEPTNLSDISQERLIRVYPYILVNADKSKTFMQNNTTSVVAYSQSSFAADTGTFHNLDIDEKGNYFFELLATVDLDGTLDISYSTSTVGLELKYENNFRGITDQFYDHRMEKPIMFTFSEPFDNYKFETGDLPVFIANKIIPAEEFTVASEMEKLSESIDQETLTEIDFVNITALEDNFQNAKIVFTDNVNIAQDLSTYDRDRGISIGFDSHMLLNNIKIKGEYELLDANGNKVVDEYGDIDLIAQSGLVPFKMTPTSTNDKLTMFADWFDYDSILPLFYGYMGQTKVKLDDIIINPTHPTSIERVEDLKMVKDMLIVSAGFASSWDFAPVITTGTETGKIKPDFRVGYIGLKAATIAGKDPIKVVDGIYENHLRKNPGFLTNKDRFQPIKALINALSRYIYSSYAIGKGQNSYNQVYLPWYFEVDETSSIKVDPSPVDIPNPDAGTTGSVDTYVLNELYLKAKSVYFNDNFTGLEPELGSSIIKIPEHIRISNQLLVQTDRKLTLPEVPEEIGPINKLPLPGDIDTTSADSLSYLWFLPINDKDNFDKLMLKDLKTQETIPVGTRVDVKLNRREWGKFWNQLDIDTATTSPLFGGQPGKIVVHANSITKTDSIGFTYALFQDQRFTAGGWVKEWFVDWINIDNGRWTKNYTPRAFIASERNQIEANTNIIKLISNLTGIAVEHIKNPNIQYRGTDGSHNLSGKVDFEYQDFSTAVVETTTASTKTFSYGKREILFDKENWESFLNDFGIISKGIKKFEFDTEPHFNIKKIDEIIIKSVWGNNLYLVYSSGGFIDIPMINNTDETISTQRIIFT